MKKEQYLGLGHKINGELQIDVLERYAKGNPRKPVTPLYCFYNYSSRARNPKYWHCCQDPVEPEQLGCTLTPASRVRQAITTRGKRTFEFIHKYEKTLPWRCMVACPELRFPAHQGLSALPDQTFPLIDNESFYEQLPFDSQAPLRNSGTDTFSLSAISIDDDTLDDEDDDYDTEVIQFAGPLTDYYDIEVGLPKAIYVTEITPR